MIRTVFACLVASLVLSAAPALAGTDLQDFQKRVAKNATLDPEKSRLTCVCTDGGGENGQAGILVQETATTSNKLAVTVACWVPLFGNPPGGSLLSFEVCSMFTTPAK